MPGKIAAASLVSCMTTLGILIDKARLLREKPTDIRGGGVNELTFGHVTVEVVEVVEPAAPISR